MVAEETNTASLGRVSATPSAPNRMASVCAALTTTLTTISASFAASAGVLAPPPPSATNRATLSAATSQPVTSKPARLSEVAMPKPIEPSPMTATRGFLVSGIRRFLWFLTAVIGSPLSLLGITAWPRCQSMRQGGKKGLNHERNQNPRGDLPARPLAVRARTDAGLIGQYQREAGGRRLPGDADQCLARLSRPGTAVAARRRAASSPPAMPRPRKCRCIPRCTRPAARRARWCICIRPIRWRSRCCRRSIPAPRCRR